MVERSILPLRLEGVELVRRGRRIVGPVDLEIAGDGLTIVLGPNGAGKTSLLRLMHGLERPSRGRVRWSISSENARPRQAFVFQAPVVMHRTILENVAYPMLLRGTARAEARNRAAAWLDRVGLGDEVDRPARVLSGGERQKMALARALVMRPEILFLDEPSASLDGRSMREIEDILKGAMADGTRMVMSTHDIGQARRLATEALFIHHGTLRAAAPAPAFFKDPASAELRAFLKGEILE